jgi:Flp pilus assembly protein CpaB
VSSRRTVILIGAIVVGVLAAFATLRYVSGVEDKAQENAKQVPILVATDTIPEGMSVAEASSLGLIAQAEIAQSNVPVDAVDSTDQLGNKVAVVDISARTPITNSLWITRDQAFVTNSERIPEGMVAVTVSVDQVRGVAGLIVPGDRVNMMVTSTSDGEDGAEAAGAAGGTAVGFLTNPAYTMFQGVEVLFVGQRAGLSPSEQGEDAEASEDSNQLVQGGSNLLTLAVPAEAAEIVASVGPASVYLSLLPPDYVYEPIVPGPPPFNLEDQPAVLLPAGDAAVITPYGPDGFQEDQK